MPRQNQIARLWVDHNEGRYARPERVGFNVYYVGDTIYSYGRHFPIARFATSPTGERVVLFTSRGYSISTAKHIGIVRRALGYRRVHYVSNPSSNDWTTLAHECAERANALKASAARRRSDWRRDDDLRQAAEAMADANMFAKWAVSEKRRAKRAA